MIVPVSVAAIADTLGLTKAAGDNASRAVGGIMATVAEHDEAPQGSVLASLAHSTLSPEEVISNLKLMMFGPAGFVGLVLWSLLVHPAELAAVRRQRALLPQAVSEALRRQSPEGATTRIARSTTLIADVEIPTGATVAVVIASANRDERRFIEPDRFVINRQEGHAAFSFGPHSCPGAHLGQLQTRVMVDRLLSRLPELQLDRDQPAHISGWMSRAPVSLPARWDA